jgi:transposase-like protein
MPWRHTSPMDQQIQCIADYLRRTLSITELCALYGLSRQTGSKWIERSLTSGPPGLEDRSRTPCSRPNQTPQHVVEAIIEVRCRHPLHGVPRTCCRFCIHVIQAGRGPGAPRSAISCAATAWSLRHVTSGLSATPANRPRCALRPTRCGAPSSQASSKPGTVSTVLP